MRKGECEMKELQEKMCVCGFKQGMIPFAEVVDLNGKDPKIVLQQMYFRDDILSIEWYTLDVVVK